MWQYNHTYYYPQRMDNELYHHGILGQKWGKRNGPPYPLNSSAKSSAEKKSSSSISGGAKEKIRKIQLTDEQKTKVKKALKVAFIAAVTVGAAVVGGRAYFKWMYGTKVSEACGALHSITELSKGRDSLGIPLLSGVYGATDAMTLTWSDGTKTFIPAHEGKKVYNYIGTTTGNVYNSDGEIGGNVKLETLGAMAMSAVAGFKASKKVSNAISEKDA